MSPIIIGIVSISRVARVKEENKFIGLFRVAPISLVPKTDG